MGQLVKAEWAITSELIVPRPPGVADTSNLTWLDYPGASISGITSFASSHISTDSTEIDADKVEAACELLSTKLPRELSLYTLDLAYVTFTCVPARHIDVLILPTFRTLQRVLGCPDCRVATSSDGQRWSGWRTPDCQHPIGTDTETRRWNNSAHPEDNDHNIVA